MSEQVGVSGEMRSTGVRGLGGGEEVERAELAERGGWFEGEGELVAGERGVPATKTKTATRWREIELADERLSDRQSIEGGRSGSGAYTQPHTEPQPSQPLRDQFAARAGTLPTSTGVATHERAPSLDDKQPYSFDPLASAVCHFFSF